MDYVVTMTVQVTADDPHEAIRFAFDDLLDRGLEMVAQVNGKDVIIRDALVPGYREDA